VIGWSIRKVIVRRRKSPGKGFIFTGMFFTTGNFRPVRMEQYPGNKILRNSSHEKRRLRMCVAIPSKIISKDGLLAIIEVYGARREVNLMLLPEEAEVGDYVLVHAGFAIQKVDVEAGKESLKLFDEVLRNLGVDPDNA